MNFQTVGKKSQTALLLDHFKKERSITGIEAEHLYRVRALPRRVKDLKAAGHRISSETKFDPTGQRYVRYHYIGAAA